MLTSIKLHQTFFIVYLPKLLTIGLLTIFCWMLAKWTWLLVVPLFPVVQTTAETTADLTAARKQITASGLFIPRVSMAKTEPIAPTTVNLKLVGVLAFTPHREQSQAVLNLNNKGNEVFREGSDIAAGIVLNEITPSHVVIRRQGNLERVEFPELKSNADQRPGYIRESQQQTASHINLSRQNLNRTLQEPGQLARLGQLTVTPGSGVVIEQAQLGSLAHKLGLQNGDVITSVNGETISRSEDLLSLYQKFNQTGKIVLGGSRKGTPLTQTYTVNP